MGTKHETSNSQVADGILSDQALRAKEVISQRGRSTNHVRTTCNKSKFGYNGTAKVDSDSLNQTGDVMMNNNIEVIQAQVDSNEKAINVGLAGHKAELAGHKAELEGHKSHVEGNFTAMFAQMEANRKVSETNHQATLDRMDADRKLWEANNKATQERMDADRVASKERADADRKLSDARFAATLERMDADRVASKERMDVSQRNLEDKIDASATSIKLWGIVTLISVVAAGAGIIATVFAMVRVLSGS